MLNSARAFLERLIDYAGLYPPAALPLDQAIRNYAAYLRGEDAWMLGKFVIPASRLEDLELYMHLFSGERPLSLSVLGTRSRQSDDCIKLLQDSLQQIELFRRRHHRTVQIDVLELPLPPVAIEPSLMHAVVSDVSASGLHVICELTFTQDDEWERNMLTMLDVIKTCNDRYAGRVGFKLRTGGTLPEAIPSPQQVAVILVACRERGLAMKFTAGLHHPVRMHRDEVKAKMHGFLNVFFAGMLANRHRLDATKTEEILADENPDSFYFTTDGIGWRDLPISVDQVRALRQNALHSFGSCSFDEPRDELRKLKSLEPGGD